MLSHSGHPISAKVFATIPTSWIGGEPVELRAGEMWNSNSMLAWLIASTGPDVDAIKPPAGGRAPGWNAGVVAGAASAAPRPCNTHD